MSGLEIVGVLASAAQLANYCVKITISITELYRSVREAPKRIKPRENQIRQLIHTTEQIKQHRVLQTAVVQCHIHATLVEATALYEILDQTARQYSRGAIRRYWKVLSASKERLIDESFDKIEREKSALTLCITTIHTSLLCSIQGGVDLLGGSLPVMPRQKSSDKRRGSTGSQKSPSTTEPARASESATAPGVTSGNKVDGQLQRKDPESYGMVPTRDPASTVHLYGRFIYDKANSPDSGGPNKAAQTLGNTQHTYSEMTAGKKSHQLNGDMGTSNASTNQASGGHRYFKCTVKHQGDQVNGNMYDTEAIKGFFRE
ncbi:MAG: hypothetical protein M1833_002646 [Piccolia ochrophora]|nr:MAG: hypothetical protein M1833_002646 [Piccolia ochrophora]